MARARVHDLSQRVQPSSVAFEISPSYVGQLISNQAASLDRALLELVVNAIDAGATRIDVAFGRDGQLCVSDNGRGFREDEIRDVFGTFGFDHDTPEERARGRTLGTFGIGRGQIMGLAAARWYSGTLVMETDVRRHGPRYLVVASEGDPVSGCRVEAVLYERVLYERVLERVRKACLS